MHTRSSHLKPEVEKSKADCFRKLQNMQKEKYDEFANKQHKPLQIGDYVKYLSQNNTWKADMITPACSPGPRDNNIKNDEQHIIRWNRIQVFTIPAPVDDCIVSRQQGRFFPTTIFRSGPTNTAIYTVPVSY